MAGKLTISQAGILWGLLTDEQKSAFKLIAGMGEKQGNAAISVVNSLFELDLIERTRNLMTGDEIVVLTAKGKTLKKLAARASEKGE